MSTSLKYLIAGNWKMNKTAAEAKELASEVVAEVGKETSVAVVVCPTFTSLETVAGVISESNVHLGAQNVYPAPSGAFTGEISPEMLRSLFAGYVILGHSERREYFGETDAFVNKKVLASLEANLRPILCVGESLEQRESGETTAVVTEQIKGGLADVPPEAAEQVVVAYEPIWAIGTGKTATPEMAQETHAAIRAVFVELFDETVADKIRILYGGSMKPSNAPELLAQPDIDGGLIGGASLKARDFAGIVEAAAAQG